MIYKEHLIELWINGNKVELEDQDSLNMRFNNVLFDPTKISSTQSEYSFEFEVPATPHNNVIFDYANNLSKDNKFHSRYNAEVYCDGIVIFSGSITVNSYKDKKYKLNLVSVKVYSLEDIFGETMMTDIRPMQRNENGTIKTGADGEPLHEKWAIEFSGVTSINERNGLLETDVVFPLVSYGAFQKSPYQRYEDDQSGDYTSKFDLDEWNRWYVESFYPSHNMLATLKNCFETKNYIVGGDAFENPYLQNVYMSVNLADGQSPDYNVGYYRFGKVDLTTTLTTNPNPSRKDVGYQQELNFPYYRVSGKDNNEYNYAAVDLYNLLSGNVTVNQDVCYLYQPDENIIVAPVDGFYKIEMSATTRLNTTSAITAAQFTRNYQDDNPEEHDLELTPGLSEITPVDIVLVKNYDDNYELIKGKNNTLYGNGNPNDEYYAIAQNRYAANAYDWLTCYPHEDPYNSMLPTEKNDLEFRNTGTNRMGGLRGSSSSSSSSSDGGRMGGQRSRTRGGTIERGSSFEGQRYYASQGYIYNDGEIMCYDQAVSEAFVCGFSSMKGGIVSVMKNGYSWSKSNATKNDAFYPEIGYSKISTSPRGGTVTEQTDYNYNTYINTPVSRISTTNTTMNAYLSCMVYLHKNDVLSLLVAQREYHDTNANDVVYSTTSTVNLKIRAFSDRTYEMLKASHDNRYEAPVEFDEKLNLANFFNKEKKMSDWVKNIVDAFNFDVIQDGNTVTINTRKKINPKTVTAVEIDDRVNSADAEASKIDYPRSMAVKYKIDTDEWGFERSAVESQGGDESILNNDDWYKYGDSGFTVIYLNDDTWETSTSDRNLQFSYTWYDKFYQYQCNSSHEKTSQDPVTLKLPVISKFTYMIDGYSYEESMKHDGYGLAQRFWFRPTGGGGTLWTRTYPPEQAVIYTPVNMYTNYQDVYFNLSYKDTEPSLLTEFFNTRSYLASNYVKVDVYLTPDEYYRIKNGAYVRFDSDLYIPVEISAYDPTGFNETTLKMMKKII